MTPPCRGEPGAAEWVNFSRAEKKDHSHLKLEGWDHACHNLIEEIKREGVRKMAKDFVCGMDIDEKKAGATYEFEGKTYYFCESACKDRFAESPQNYIGK